MKQTRTKADLARALGISATTLRKWLEPYLAVLESMGVSRNAKTLTPKAVKFLTKEFDIDWQEHIEKQRKAHKSTLTHLIRNESKETQTRIAEKQ